MLSTLYYVLCTGVYASDEFNTDFDVTYRVHETGITEVNNKITLTNIFSNLYATSYSIVLDNINPANIKAYDEKGPLEIIKNITNKTVSLQVKFKDPVVGKDKSRVFWVSFEEPSFAIRTGEVWEVSIPRLSENAKFASYYISLEVPESFGQEAYISPTPRDIFKLDGLLKYKFNKEDIQKTGITAGFGQFQVFSFNLNYHLENPLNKSLKLFLTSLSLTKCSLYSFSNLS